MVDTSILPPEIQDIIIEDVNPEAKVEVDTLPVLEEDQVEESNETYLRDNFGISLNAMKEWKKVRIFITKMYSLILFSLINY